MEITLRTPRGPLVVMLAAERDCTTATLDGRAHQITQLWARSAPHVAGGTIDDLALEIDGQPMRALVARTREQITVVLRGRTFTFGVGEEARRGGGGGDGASGSVVAPMPGKVIAVLVQPGDVVEPGTPLVVLEAMKMESTLSAEIAGTVRAVPATVGATVGAGEVLAEIAPAESIA